MVVIDQHCTGTIKTVLEQGNDILERVTLYWIAYRKLKEDFRMTFSTKLSTAERRALSGKITLREARLNCGFKVEEVTAETGFSTSELAQIEEDASEVSAHLILKLIALYNTDWNHIYAGRAEDVYRARKYVTDFSEVSEVSRIKSELAVLIHLVLDERNSRERVSEWMQETFYNVHKYESKLLRPFISGCIDKEEGKGYES